MDAGGGGVNLQTHSQFECIYSTVHLFKKTVFEGVYKVNIVCDRLKLKPEKYSNWWQKRTKWESIVSKTISNNNEVQ